LNSTALIGSGEFSQEIQNWLHSGILTVAILAFLVSIYAMSAAVYRTVGGGITINRLTIVDGTTFIWDANGNLISDLICFTELSANNWCIV